MTKTEVIKRWETALERDDYAMDHEWRDSLIDNEKFQELLKKHTGRIIAYATRENSTGVLASAAVLFEYGYVLGRVEAEAEETHTVM